MRLRTWFHLVGLAFFGTVLVAAVALFLTTGELAGAAARVGTRLEHADRLTRLSQALSSHRRHDLLWRLTRERSDLHQLQQAEEHLLDELQLVVGQADSPGERSEAHRIDLAVHRYLAEARAAEHPLPSPQRENAVEVPFQEAREEIFGLAAAQLEGVSSLPADAQRLERGAWALGFGLLAVSALGAAAMLLSLRRRFVRPVEKLLASMRRMRADGQVEPVALPGEFGELQAALQEMTETIRRQRAQQLTFISGVAHDLRNPIAAMKLHSELLARADVPPTPERLQRLTLVFQRQLDRLQRQIDDLLESSRIEAGNVQLRPEITDLAALVRETASLFEHGGATHPLQLDVPESLLCRVDPVRLHQVLTNLVSNAIKYSPEGGPVRIRLAEEQGRAHLSVQDEGLGMTAEDLAHLFEPFRRGRMEQLRIPGTGLGLSVTKKIVEAHGGTISVESAPGRGSTFHVELPEVVHEPALPLEEERRQLH